MRAVKAKDTGPEMIVRRLVHGLGYRFRLHRADLPGKPDLVFPGRRAAIFVHGCFWHGHDCARGARTPKENRAYWTRKIARNAERDVAAVKDLRSLGWRTLTLWECELKKPGLAGRVGRFLG
jgi:DNA mismatch endonuclease (patch repair protein)